MNQLAQVAPTATEMDGEPFLTKRGWYYISKTRKHGRNPLWVGPFDSADAANADAETVASRSVDDEGSVIKAPIGYMLINSGQVKEGDLLWNFALCSWSTVPAPLPFRSGQKRPGSGQVSDIGRCVTQYAAVARKP